MKRNFMAQAAAGIALLLLGAAAVYFPSRRYEERHVLASAGTCHVDMTIVQLRDPALRAQSGAVVLFHGLSANKMIMQYLARTFAELGLTVYVPDLPGHGHTAGPFSPQQAEACSISLLRGLAARGLIVPDRTILAGHSMGGAIVLRTAPQFRPAGVIALSPAPMRAAHGVTSEKLLYPDLPRPVPNTLLTAGQFEPQGLAANAADLVAENSDPTIEFHLLKGQSHVSVLFSPATARLAQNWAARVLQIPAATRTPSLLFFLGGLLGFVGILLIAGPFLREMAAEAPSEPPSTNAVPSTPRFLSELLLISVAALFLLRYFVPLRPMGLFEGDYAASFFLLTGLLLLLLHPKLALVKFSARPGVLLSAAFAALVLHLLVTGWFELTVTGAWLTWQKWSRFPIFFLAVFIFFYAVELLLGPVLQPRLRLLLDLAAVLLAWLVMFAGVFLLHSGEILMVLLLPYFALFFLFSRLGARLVRQRTASPLAAAIFSAILMAGFSLVLFPVS